MGQPQHSLSQPVSARPRGLPLRSCLRKHCGHTFQPKRWKQRYCRDPECARELRRWQATKRQRKRREQPEVRQRHAAAERKRRASQRQVACATENVPELRCLDPHQQACQPLATTPEAFPAVPIEPLSTANPAMQQEGQAPSGTNNCHEAREEVPATRPDADQAHETSAWSRRRKTFGPTCDRPGCYEPPRDSRSGLACYCSDDCRQAMRRTRDRERKWQSRKTSAGQFKRRLEYQARRIARSARQSRCRERSDRRFSQRRRAVGDYWTSVCPQVRSGDLKEVPGDDQETNSGVGPRSPPSV